MMAWICAGTGATCTTPVRFLRAVPSSATILANEGAATSVNTTGMSLMNFSGVGVSCGPTMPSVTVVPHV